MSSASRWRYRRRTRPSARSPASRRVGRWRRSTPSRPSWSRITGLCPVLRKAPAPPSMVDEENEPQPSEEELLEQLEGELNKLKISDVLVQTVFTVSSLGYRRLG